MNQFILGFSAQGTLTLRKEVNIHAKNCCKNYYDGLSIMRISYATGHNMQISNNGGRLYGYSYYVMV